jgi:cytidylate kinase
LSKVIVAVDGPAGSGKSSVCKEVAKRLNYGYLDTGAAYRALAWAVLEGQVEIEKVSVADLIIEFAYAISLDPNNFWVRVGKTDVTSAIREPRVSELVSSVAGVSEVRKYMHNLTKSLVNNAEFRGVIVEGRDITTGIFPDAQTRILLTASEAVRLERRSKELPVDISAEEQVINRDKADSKVVDFIRPARGVKLLDSTNLTFEETVTAVINLVQAAKES